MWEFGRAFYVHLLTIIIIIIIIIIIVVVIIVVVVISSADVALFWLILFGVEDNFVGLGLRFLFALDA